MEIICYKFHWKETSWQLVDVCELYFFSLLAVLDAARTRWILKKHPVWDLALKYVFKWYCHEMGLLHLPAVLDILECTLLYSKIYGLLLSVIMTVHSCNSLGRYWCAYNIHFNLQPESLFTSYLERSIYCELDKKFFQVTFFINTHASF